MRSAPDPVNAEEEGCRVAVASAVIRNNLALATPATEKDGIAEASYFFVHATPA